jgi:hypothetical protein
VEGLGNYCDIHTGLNAVESSTSPDTEGTDNNGSNETIIAGWDCYFQDGMVVNGGSTDSAVGFGLLNNPGSYNYVNMVCVLDIEN